MQLLTYLGFAALCTLAYLMGVRRFPGNLRRTSSDPWLSGRERWQLEMATGLELRQRMEHDPHERRRFVDHYLARQGQCKRRLRDHIRQDALATQRLVHLSIRQLDDRALLHLARLLGLAPDAPALPPQRMGSSSSGPAPRHPFAASRLIGLAGAALLMLMLLCPPWVVAQQRHTYMIGRGETRVRELQRTVSGYHWFGDPSIPVPQITRRHTHDLQTVQQDETVWKINYARLACQTCVLVLLIKGTLFERHRRAA